MPVPDSTFISAQPPSAETLNFRALLRAGIEEAQTLSSEHWTDFNEHDPGVTILEYLCFALTDLGYRTSHPIEDILSSSAAVTGVGLDEQPLFTGDRALTCSPLTRNDYRKLIYDSVRGVRNVWLNRVEDDVKGLFDVYIQRFAPTAGHDTFGDADKARIRNEVVELLYSHRNIGEDVNSVTIIAENSFRLDTHIDIAPNIDPESAVARMLFNIEMRLNPVPELNDVDSEFEKSVPVDKVFEGPRLSHGIISDSSLRALRSDIPLPLVLEAMRNTAGIQRIRKMDIMPLVEKLHDAVTAPVLSRELGDFEYIKLYRDGVPVELKPERVLYYLQHVEKKQRWQAVIGMRRMLGAVYMSVPQGNPRRELSRYRSIQHLFPSVYGLGKYGAGQDIYPSQAGRDSAAQRNRREAEVRQLKAYLLFFEQLLSDYLAQLENTAQLFSFKALEQTYFWQPLVRLEAEDDDDPPDIRPVLGSEMQDRRGHGGARASEQWHEDYLAGLDQLTRSHDSVYERQNRALDHLLARFNEEFDNERLKRLNDRKSDDPDLFGSWIANLKREFLANYPDISANRGVGRSVVALQECLLEKAIRLKSGFDGQVFILDHVLLRGADGALEDGATDAAQDSDGQAEEAVTAVRLSSPNETNPRFTAHWVLDRLPSHLGWHKLAKRIAHLGANRRNYRAYVPGAYQVSVRIDDGAGTAAEVLENFRSWREAELAINRMVELCTNADKDEAALQALLEPALLPLDFSRQSASVFLAVNRSCADELRNDHYRAFVETTVTDNMPAHISHYCFWLDEGDWPRFKRDYRRWLAITRVFRRTENPGQWCRDQAQAASDRLRRLIHRRYCDLILDSRGARRQAMNAAPSVPG